MEMSSSPSHSLGDSHIGRSGRQKKKKKLGHASTVAGDAYAQPMLSVNSDDGGGGGGGSGGRGGRFRHGPGHNVHHHREQQAAALSEAYGHDAMLNNVELRLADKEAVKERQRIRRASSKVRRANSRGLRRNMSIEEMLTKNTWQKWMQFGRFPAKMVLHVLLLLTQSAQIVYLTKQMSYFHRFSTRTFESFFMPEDCLGADNAPYPIGGFKDCYLFTQEDTVEQVISAINAVREIQYESVDFYRDISNASFPQASQVLIVETYNEVGGEAFFPNASNSGATTTDYDDDIVVTSQTYEVSPGDFGPFQDMTSQNRSKFFHNLYSMTHEINLGTWVAQVYRACVTWNVRVNYVFNYGASIAVGIETNILENWCEEETVISRLFHNLNVFNWAIIAICIPYFGLICTSLYRSCVVYRRVRGVLSKIEGRTLAAAGRPQTASAGQMRQRSLDAKAKVMSGERSGTGPRRGGAGDADGGGGDDDVTATDAGQYMEYTVIWNRLTCWDKIKFFRWWVVCTFIAILTNTVASVMRLVHSFNNNQMGAADDEWTMWLDSIGIALLYIQVLHYFEHRYEYFQLIATLQTGIPRVLKFLVGVAPLLLAYNFVGMIFFANYSPFFANFGAGMITLFAVMNGDEVADSFDQMTTAQPVMSQVFWYTYICLFIFVVLNIFIAIIEAAHEVTELQHSNDFGGNVHDTRRPITKHLLAQAMRLLNADTRRSDVADAKRRARDTLIRVASPRAAASTTGVLQGLQRPPSGDGDFRSTPLPRSDPVAVGGGGGAAEANARGGSSRTAQLFKLGGGGGGGGGGGAAASGAEAEDPDAAARQEPLLGSDDDGGGDDADGDDGSDDDGRVDAETLMRVRHNSFHGSADAEEKQVALDALLDFASRR